MSCNHEGFHSGVGRYCSETKHLRYVLVCDECQAEVSEVHAEPYRPSYDPRGNDPYRPAA